MSAETVQLEEFNELPISVESIEFVGLERTRPEIMQSALNPCRQARTFGELTECLSQASRRLDQLDIFKEMRFVIDRGDDGQKHNWDQSQPQGQAQDQGQGSVLVRVEAREKKYKFNAGTNIRKNEVGFGLGGVFYNIFGRGERLDVQGALGSQSATPISLCLSRPLGGDPDQRLDFSLNSTLQHHSNDTGYKTKLRGLAVSYSFLSPLHSRHDLKYSLDWRHIFGIRDGSSATVRRNAGHSLKSSIMHTMSVSTRDSHIFPESGVFARLNTELAGLGGSVGFLKNDLYAQMALPIYAQLVLGASFRLGHVVPLAGHRLSIIDKYQLGGPLSVRGFAFNSLGPKDQSDSIGGDLSAETGVQLCFPLSHGTSQIVRGHIFANVGVLTDFNYRRPFLKSLWGSLAMPNASVGVGLQIKLGEAGKLELNVSHPISMQPEAVFHRGIQVGLGFEFL